MINNDEDYLIRRTYTNYGGRKMSKEEIEILKELSEQSYFGDLPFLYYGDLIGKLLANYNKEKEENKKLRQCHLRYEEMTGIDLLLGDD